LIEGQHPRVPWRPNQGGQHRTIEEAVAIARRHGVEIPDDVAFFLDEFGDLGPDTTARGPKITKTAGSLVRWSDFVHDRTGKVPFLIRPDVLGSDEAIVAVLAHEMYELENLRRLLEHGRMTIEDFIAHVAPGNRGNLHDQAWNEADAAVLRMREVDP
jgi:hypothetical protein